MCRGDGRVGEFHSLAALKRQYGEAVSLPRSSNSKRFAGLEFENGKIFSEDR